MHQQRWRWVIISNPSNQVVIRSQPFDYSNRSNQTVLQSWVLPDCSDCTTWLHSDCYLIAQVVLSDYILITPRLYNVLLDYWQITFERSDCTQDCSDSTAERSASTAERLRRTSERSVSTVWALKLHCNVRHVYCLICIAVLSDCLWALSSYCLIVYWSLKLYLLIVYWALRLYCLIVLSA